MSHHVAGTWWAIERYDDERREWVLQWNAAEPCWPRLFTRRAEVRAYLAERVVNGLVWHWRLRPVMVKVVRA